MTWINVVNMTFINVFIYFYYRIFIEKFYLFLICLLSIFRLVRVIFTSWWHWSAHTSFSLSFFFSRGCPGVVFICRFLWGPHCIVVNLFLTFNVYFHVTLVFLRLPCLSTFPFCLALHFFRFTLCNR